MRVLRHMPDKEVFVTEKTGVPASMDPTELWQQWYDAGTKMWSEVMRGSQERYADPYGLYRQWFTGLQEIQERMAGISTGASNGTPGAANMQNLWQRWFEATSEAWRKSAGLGQNAMEIYPRWIQMLEEARDNLLAAGTPPTDPLQFASQWYNATSGPFSDFVGDVIEREEFLEPSSQFLQHYASFYKVFKRNSEELLKNLQVPVRSDITRVASLIVALEDKVDRLEEAFEEFEYGYAKPATAEEVAVLEKRLDRVESKLDRLLAALENGAAAGGTQSEAPTVQEVAQTNGSPVEVKATDAARRKAREMGVDLATVQGTGADGQITVDDVRKKGES